MARYCDAPEISDYIARLRNEKRKDHKAARTVDRRVTRNAVADHYASL